MKGIDILVEQHENVLVFVDVVKDKCLKIFTKIRIFTFSKCSYG